MDLNQRLTRLSPEQLQLLRKKLEESEIDIYRLTIHIQDRKQKSRFPLSFGQERLWFAQQLAPDMNTYDIIRATRLEGNLNREALEWGINEIVRRHEILRASFSFDGIKPVQIISADISVAMQFTDLTEIPQEKQSGIVCEIVQDEARHAFDLSRAPLLRIKLLKLHEDVHLFLLHIHHIVADALSVQIFIRELLRLYESFCQNKSSPLPALSIQYADYACWQREWFGEDGLGLGFRKKQETFWLDRFSGEVPALTLPTDYPRPAMQSFEGDRLAFQMEFHEINSMKQLALKAECSFYIIMLTLFNILLSKLSGMEVIVVGAPVTGRRHTAVRNLIGMFVNMLPLINFIYPDKTFRELLKEVRDGTLTAFENQEYPYGDIIERINTDNRITGRNPLFDVVFNLTKSSIALFDSTTAGLSFKAHEQYNQTATFDLTLEVFDAEDRVNFNFEYCTKLFKRSTVERFIGCFKKIAAVVIHSPQIRLWEIEIITDKEKQEILHDLNDTAEEFPQNRTVHEWFEDQAASTPHHAALVMNDRQISYEELNRRAEMLAGYLLEKSAVPGDVIALLLDRSLEMIMGILSILKAGGAYLPIEPDYPFGRIEYMIRDSGAEIILTDITQRPFTMCSSVSIYEIPDTGYPGRGKVSSLEREHSPTNPAYVIYTSGSTGKPKGVIISHRNVVAYLYAFFREFDISANDTALQQASYAFDAFVEEVYPAILRGGKVAICPRTVLLDSDALGRFIVKYLVTFVSVSPLLLKEINKLQDTGHVRIFISGGDVLKQEYIGQLSERGSVYNTYGPTETTVCATYHRCRPQYGTHPPIGRPIANYKTVILDRYGRLLPAGALGELCITGPGVSRGYLNNPELTADRFMGPPFPFSRSYMLYRTGDLARFLPDNGIEFLGRIDCQIKIRGFRIELQEIETQLVKHPQVENVVVLDRQDKDKNSYLAAYFVPLPTEGYVAKKFIKTLRESLSQYLPEYMIPAYFVPLDKIPLTANGKVDRQALPEPDIELAMEDYVAPRNQKEERLASVWKEVLGIQSVGITDNFFQIGGDSIRAIQVSSRLKNYGLVLKTADLFFHPTIKVLGDYVEESRQRIDQRMVEGKVELTPTQQWFFQYGFAHEQLFCQSVLLYRKEGFNEKIVTKVLESIVEHHDALRMIYKHENGHINQLNRTIEGKLFDFEVINFNETVDMTEIIKKEFQRIQGDFDLGKGPLLKTALFTTAVGDYMLIVIHNLVVDELSWRVLLKDLATGYRQLILGKELQLPEKTHSFQYWTRELKRYAERGEEEEGSILSELEYWRLVDMAPLEHLPVDAAIGIEKRENKYSNLLMIKLDRRQTGILMNEVNWAYNTEINDILLSALGLAIMEWRGVKKVCVNLEGECRDAVIDEIDVSRTVGLFKSLYPVVLNMAGSKDLSQVIKNVKETLRRVPRYGTGYGILKYLTPDEKKRRYPFKSEPEIKFNFLERLGESIEIAEDTNAEISELFTVSRMMIGLDAHSQLKRPYKLEINGTVQDNQLQLSFIYNKLEFIKESMDQLAGCYRSNLLKLIDHCSSRKEQELTPSDLGYTAIDVQDLEEIENDLCDIDG